MIKNVYLTDVCDFQGGSQPPKASWSKILEDGYVRMLQIRDFTQRNDSHIEYLKDSQNLKKCEADDILIARYGASIGKILTGLSGAYNVAIVKTVPDENKIYKRFLYYVLKGKGFQEFIQNIGSRAAQAGFNKTDLKKFQILLPSLEDQKRIVSILDRADALQQKRKQAIGLLDDYLRSAFLEMFGDPVKNPKKWKVDSLGNLCHRLSDGPFGSKLKSEHYVEKGIRVIRLQNIGINEFKDNDKAYISKSYYEHELKGYSCKPGEIVIATLGDPNIRACLVPNDIELSINKADCIHCLPDKELLTPKYLVTLLNLPQFHHSFYNLIHGQTRGRVSSGQLKNIKIPVPTVELQNKFAEIVQKTATLKQKMLAQSEELEAQFQALMQKAFKGDL